MQIPYSCISTFYLVKFQNESVFIIANFEEFLEFDKVRIENIKRLASGKHRNLIFFEPGIFVD